MATCHFLLFAVLDNQFCQVVRQVSVLSARTRRQDFLTVAFSSLRWTMHLNCQHFILFSWVLVIPVIDPVAQIV